MNAEPREEDSAAYTMVLFMCCLLALRQLFLPLFCDHSHGAAATLVFSVLLFFSCSFLVAGSSCCVASCMVQRAHQPLLSENPPCRQDSSS